MYLKAWKHLNPNNDPLPTDLPTEALEAGIGEQPWEYKRRLTAWIYKYKKGEATLREHAKLTQVGQQLLETMSENMAKVLKEAGLE